MGGEASGALVAREFGEDKELGLGEIKRRGNREWLDRMSALGLVECLRHTTGMLTPTHRNARGGAIIHQIDHLFTTSHLADHLVTCFTGIPDKIFGVEPNDRLSDHLPIVADFAL